MTDFLNERRRYKHIQDIFTLNFVTLAPASLGCVCLKYTIHPFNIQVTIILFYSPMPILGGKYEC